MGEKNPEIKGRPNPIEKPPAKDPTKVAKGLGRTAIDGATKK